MPEGLWSARDMMREGELEGDPLARRSTHSQPSFEEMGHVRLHLPPWLDDELEAL
jgi:hypothetical protein